MLLERLDPFLADFDRITQQVLETPGAGVPMDVTRRGEEIIVRLDLPGVATDKVTVTVENRVLTVSAERASTRGEDEQVLLAERFEGAVSRRIRVPEWVDSGRVTADYADGVLTVRLPLAEQARPRRIEIRAGAPAQQINV